MYQTDQATAASSLPTPAAAGTQGYFTNGNPASGVAATIVDADWLNMVQQELINVVTAAGITPSKTTYNQVLSALRSVGVFQTPAQFDNSTKPATTAFVKQAGFQFSQTSQYTSGPLTLTASQAGSFIDLASAYTGAVTLPALSSVPDGATFYIWSGASAAVTVQRAGSDTIFVNGSTANSLTLNNGDTLVIGKSGPAGSWVAMWGSAQFPYSAIGASLAPKPATASGVGQFQIVIATTGGAFTLPAGGTWAYFALPFNTSGNVATSSPAPQAGVGAGGTSPGTATAGYFWYGFVWRLQ